MRLDLVGDFQINKGSTWSLQLQFRDAAGAAMNITGYSARMMLRVAVDAASALLSLSTAGGGGIAITDASAGKITVTITAAQTAALPEGVLVYDIELESGAGLVTRKLAGQGLVTQEVTR
jgi:hypothetical protein